MIQVIFAYNHVESNGTDKSWKGHEMANTTNIA